MAFSDYDTFVLRDDLPDGSVASGAVGVVLLTLGGSPCAYEVEFPDGTGGNLGKQATYTLLESAMLSGGGS